MNANSRGSRAFRPISRVSLKVGESASRTFPAGSYAIDMVQPMARLARTLLDPLVESADPQVLVPYSRKMPYYDTTWSVMPFLFGVEAHAVEVERGAEYLRIDCRPSDGIALALRSQAEIFVDKSLFESQKQVIDMRDEDDYPEED